MSMFQAGVERVLAAAMSPARQQQPRFSRVVHLGEVEPDAPSPSSSSNFSPSSRLFSRIIPSNPWLSSPRLTLLSSRQTPFGSSEATREGSIPDTNVEPLATQSFFDVSSDPSLLHAPVEASVSKQALYIYSREVIILSFLHFLCQIK